MADRLQKESFEPHIGETFQILLGEGQMVAAELSSVDSLGKVPDAAMIPDFEQQRTEAFKLTFRVSVDAALPQMMYPITHASLGKINIFLVPVGRDENGRYHEAVFN